MLGSSQRLEAERRGEAKAFLPFFLSFSSNGHVWVPSTTPQPLSHPPCWPQLPVSISHWWAPLFVHPGMSGHVWVPSTAPQPLGHLPCWPQLPVTIFHWWAPLFDHPGNSQVPLVFTHLKAWANCVNLGILCF